MLPSTLSEQAVDTQNLASDTQCNNMMMPFYIGTRKDNTCGKCDFPLPSRSSNNWPSFRGPWISVQFILIICDTKNSVVKTTRILNKNIHSHVYPTNCHTILCTKSTIKTSIHIPSVKYKDVIIHRSLYIIIFFQIRTSNSRDHVWEV